MTIVTLLVQDSKLLYAPKIRSGPKPSAITAGRFHERVHDEVFIGSLDRGEWLMTMLKV